MTDGSERRVPEVWPVDPEDKVGEPDSCAQMTGSKGWNVGPKGEATGSVGQTIAILKKGPSWQSPGGVLRGIKVPICPLLELGH